MLIIFFCFQALLKSLFWRHFDRWEFHVCTSKQRQMNFSTSFVYFDSLSQNKFNIFSYYLYIQSAPVSTSVVVRAPQPIVDIMVSKVTTTTMLVDAQGSIAQPIDVINHTTTLPESISTSVLTDVSVKVEAPTKLYADSFARSMMIRKNSPFLMLRQLPNGILIV